MYVRILIFGCAIGLALTVICLGAAGSTIADAVMKGDIVAVRALLAQKTDVNDPQVDGATALHWAVYRDSLEMADLLIRAGADVKATSREGVTPLAMAALQGNPVMIEKLLNAGADANERGPNGVTALMRAARNGNPNAIQVLLAHGAEVNAKETLRGTTALMWAVEQEHPAAVKALIGGGADVSARSSGAGVPTPYMASSVSTLTPFDTQLGGAANGPQGGRIQTPTNDQGARGARGARGAAPVRDDQEDEGPIAGARGSGGGGLSALAFAARQGSAESARILLDAKADVNQKTEFGWSPLLVATENRNYRLGMFLIERGADVNLANKHGWTPLYLATDNRNIEGGDYPVPKPDMDHLEYIKILLDHGANANARVAEGNPKSHSTLTRTIFTMQWFFEEGATPFVRAAQSGDLTLMKLLLASGADPKIPTTFGDDALSAAAGIGWVEGVTHEMSAKETLEAVRLLLDLGLDPNSTNRDARTPLMGAAHKGRADVIQLLVDRGAKLETRDIGSRDTHNTDLSGHGGWQAVDYADGLVRVGVQSAQAHSEAATLLRKLMAAAGLPVPPVNRDLGYVCAVQGPLCQNPNGTK
jgi:ankyrin repeat protein